MPEPNVVTDAPDNTAAVDPSQPVVFFDGVCGLCNRTVNFLLARDTRRRLKFAPLQGSTARAVLPADVRSSLDTLVLAHRGRLFYRSTAVVRTLMLLTGVWHVVGWLLWLIPSPLRNAGYRMVSALRYRIWGRTEACRLPTPEERSQFLE
ncbi:MAG: DCC1-like thiol-disulfide oxidoreductase family protein [Planctomycetaceae bacterium]